MEAAIQFFSKLLAESRMFLLDMPVSIMYFGIISGFMAAASGWERYNHNRKGLLSEICGASNHLAIVFCYVMAAYILFFFSLKSLIYYLAALILGVVAAKAVQYITGQIELAGSVIATLLAVISGPLVLFVSWLFYTEQLVSTVTKIIR